MAKDGIRVHFKGGAKLDRALAQMAITHQSATSKIVNQSLSAGATQVKKSVQAVTPEFHKDTVVQGKGRSPLKITKGQLKRSIKSGLRTKAKISRNSFLAGVWIQNKKGGASDNADGWFAKQVIEKHAPNAFGYTGGNDFVKRGYKAGESKFRQKVGSQLAKKIAKLHQTIINSNLK